MNEGANNYEEAYMDAFAEGVASTVGTMMPCSVISYDRDTHVVRVKPRLAASEPTGFTEMPEVECTALRMFSGGFLIDMPISVGDTGWIFAADGDTDIVKSNCVFDGNANAVKTQAPNTQLSHCFQHGIFIPDRWGYSYNRSTAKKKDEKHVTAFGKVEDDYNRLVIQSEDGRQKISIGTNGGTLDVRVDAGSSVTVNAPFVNVNAESVFVDTQSLDVTASAGVTFDTPEVNVTGKLTVAGGKDGMVSQDEANIVAGGVIMSS